MGKKKLDTYELEDLEILKKNKNIKKNELCLCDICNVQVVKYNFSHHYNSVQHKKILSIYKTIREKDNIIKEKEKEIEETNIFLSQFKNILNKTQHIKQII